MDREYPNSGALFQNKVKKSPKAPDYRGDVLLDLTALGCGQGTVKLELAGWKKTSQKGTTFLSLKVSVPQERSEGGYKAPRPTQQYGDDEDAPF